jgi:hypothetical protein
MATLTGAQGIATGQRHAAIVCTSQVRASAGSWHGSPSNRMLWERKKKEKGKKKIKKGERRRRKGWNRRREKHLRTGLWVHAMRHHRQ